MKHSVPYQVIPFFCLTSDKYSL